MRRWIEFVTGWKGISRHILSLDSDFVNWSERIQSIKVADVIDQYSMNKIWFLFKYAHRHTIITIAAYPYLNADGYF